MSALLLLVACSSSPVHVDLAETMPLADTSLPEGVLWPHEQQDDDAFAHRAWWWQWQEPVLDRLLERVLANNPSIHTAALNYRLAQQQAGIAHAQYQPRASMAAGVSDSHTRQSSQHAMNSSVSASWELDLWGSRRALQEQAVANMEQNLAQLRAAQVSLIANAVQVYVDLRVAQQQRQLAEQAIVIRKRSYDLVRWQRQAGLVTELAEAQAHTVWQQALAALPSSEQTVQIALNRLQALAADELHDLSEQLTEPQPLPQWQSEHVLYMSANSLRQRPDVAAQEMAIRAQTEAVVLARHRRYPSFALSGSVSASGLNVADMFSVDAMVARLAANLSYVLFDGGVLKQAIQTQQVQLEHSLNNYRNTLINAHEDVSNALLRLHTSQQQNDAIQQAYASAALALQLAEWQYEAGLLDFQQLLEQQSSWLAAENAQLNHQGSLLSSWIQLYRSLGGGWQGLDLPVIAQHPQGIVHE